MKVVIDFLQRHQRCCTDCVPFKSLLNQVWRFSGQEQ